LFIACHTVKLAEPAPSASPPEAETPCWAFNGGRLKPINKNKIINTFNFTISIVKVCEFTETQAKLSYRNLTKKFYQKMKLADKK